MAEPDDNIFLCDLCVLCGEFLFYYREVRWNVTK